MSAWLLLLALRDYLAPRLDSFPLGLHRRKDDARPKPAEEMRACAILLGSMPPTSSEAYSAAPFLLIQAMDGEDTPDGFENLRIALRVCITAEDGEAAETDLLNLISVLRRWLLELPGGVLPQAPLRSAPQASGHVQGAIGPGGKFRLMPTGETLSRLPWTRPDEQAQPFLQAHIFTQWQTLGTARKPAPAMVDYE